MSTNKRSKQFGADEVKMLLELLEENRAILSKKTDVVSNSTKEAAWARLTTRFNATNLTSRDTNQLKLKWDNLKKAAKKRAALITSNNRATGGGPCTIGEDPILDQVISMTKLSCFGMPNNFDSDAGEVEIQIENGACGIFDDITNGDNTQPMDAVEIVSELEVENTEATSATSKWKTWTPASLKTPVNPKLKASRKNLLDEERRSKIARNNAIARYYEYKLKVLKDKNLKEDSD